MMVMWMVVNYKLSWISTTTQVNRGK